MNASTAHQHNFIDPVGIANGQSQRQGTTERITNNMGFLNA